MLNTEHQKSIGYSVSTGFFFFFFFFEKRLLIRLFRVGDVAGSMRAGHSSTV